LAVIIIDIASYEQQSNLSLSQDHFKIESHAAFYCGVYSFCSGGYSPMNSECLPQWFNWYNDDTIIGLLTGTWPVVNGRSPVLKERVFYKRM